VKLFNEELLIQIFKDRKGTNCSFLVYDDGKPYKVINIYAFSFVLFLHSLEEEGLL
jgi:hypothetical protein